MKKALSLWLSLIYLFTAQLTVHAFTMHPASHDTTEHHHHDDQDCDCWHKQDAHNHASHNTHNETDHGSHDMTMCMEQSVWVLALNTIDTTSYDIDYILPIWGILTNQQHPLDHYFYSINDPWRWDHWWFSDFLNNDLYGHWVIMHC